MILRFWIKCLAITIVTLVLTWMAYRFVQIPYFRLLFPETVALDDFEFTDLAFRLRNGPPNNESITIVNVGNRGRAEIAEMIEIINSYQPRVLGVDVLFNCPTLRDSLNCLHGMDTTLNGQLRRAIQRVPRIVMVSALRQTARNPDVDVYDSLETSDGEFIAGAHTGYGNVTLSGGSAMATVRTFEPVTDVSGKNEVSFAVAVSALYDSVRTQKLLARNKKEEVINFRANIRYGLNEYDSSLRVIDHYAILNRNFDSALIRDKIVVMGFTGTDLYDSETERQKFITPLNSAPIGRTFPDMYSVVLQANIIAMILNEDYVEVPGMVGEFAFALVACLLHVAMLLWMHHRWSKWYDVFAVGLVIIQLVIYAELRLGLFIWFSYKLELDITLAALAIAGFSVNLYVSVLKTPFDWISSRVNKKID